MNRQAQAVVLFLVGGAMVHAGSTDLYLRYVKAGLQPLVIGAGVVLIVAALATVWYERKRAKTGSGKEVHAHREPRVAWLLVLPLFALILVAPPALGSYSALRTGTSLQEPLAYAPLPAGDPVRLSLVDYAGRAAYDGGRSLGDRRIAITGFVALDGKGTPYLVRMALNCCAADAQPVKVGLTGRIPPVLQPDTWLELTGTYTDKRTRDPVNEGIIPFFDITGFKPVPAPRDPYDESWNN
ncbi:TIGR03943 family putative permease subunit [Streptomyces sp. NPDC020898]|uniref:TIGR03943 family putative permease subunit n=1 Tax=Streptomyces sp. NPDC020898 TaxID=3365101 RepID=UPI00378D627A